MGSQNLRPRCVLAFAHGHMVILREVHDVWKSALTLYVQISASCSYTKKVKKKYLDTMHHLYVLVSERGGGAEKRLVFVSKKNCFFTNDPLVKSCYS